MGLVVWLLLVTASCSYLGTASFADAASDGGVGSGIDGPAQCRNGIQDGNESDVDCSGPCAPCAVGKHCSDPAQCTSLVCGVQATCEAPSFTDGVKNGSETGVDCGGSKAAPKCADRQGCREPDDCVNGVCRDASCVAPGASDGVKNGAETDVDCGGSAAPRCDDGKSCKQASDCGSSACKAPPGVCVPATAIDGVKNAGETDIDCGGPGVGVPRCEPSQICAAASDCSSAVCTGLLCQPPSSTDGVKNGDESDADCGGTLTGAPRCEAGKACTRSDDCAQGCSYAKLCIDSRSCVRFRGGVTCGEHETEDVGGQPQESCCALGPAFAAGGHSIVLEKYQATAGRMRAFVEATDGDMRGWIQAHRPAWWNAGWDAKLPTNKFDAEYGLGPYASDGTARNGCSYVDSFGTSARVYDTDSAINGSNGQPDRAVEIARDQLDEKALNCVSWHMAAAMCAFDGRRLATQVANQAAIAGNDGRAWPWGGEAGPTGPANAAGFPAAVAAGASFTGRRLMTVWNAGSWRTGPADPGLPNAYAYSWPLGAQTENSRGVSAPGRMYAGKGPFGHYDLLGNHLQWDGGGAQFFYNTYSWEVHGYSSNPAVAYANEAYHAIGFRCMLQQ